MFNESELNSFAILLDKQVGWRIAANEQEKIKNILLNRLHILKLGSLESYCTFLQQNNFASQQEWQYLIEKITILESFFLRDKGQFKLLKQQILPDLIHRNRHKKRLKIWSAGCSTGEEPYSLALLIKQLLVDYQEWEILILGTDINSSALEKAKQGIYSRWSLRGVDEDVLQYFQKQNDLLLLTPSIKNMVSFQKLNLLTDVFPNSLITDIDLILCRNVFIYFTPDSIGKVLTKFSQSLSNEGYLITGHGELYQQPLPDLQALLFPESLIYKRSIASSVSKIEPSLPQPKPKINFLPQIEAILPLTNTKSVLKEKERVFTKDDFIELYQQGKYQEIILIAEKNIDLSSHKFDYYYWMAKAYANLGDYVNAEQKLQKALQINDLSCVCHYLLAHIKELQNDSLQAKLLLHKVLFLNNQFIPAYLDLAVLYRHEDNIIKAEKMQSNALKLLKELPKEQYIEEFEANAEDIILQLEAIIS